jgi:hypothetical protein
LAITASYPAWAHAVCARPVELVVQLPVPLRQLFQFFAHPAPFGEECRVVYPIFNG